MRWNLPFSDAMRNLCYSPLLPPHSPKQPAQQANNPSVDQSASFSASRKPHDNMRLRAKHTTSENPVDQSGSGSCVPMPNRRLRAFAGMCAAFFISGVFHECIVWGIRGSLSTHLKMFWFFMIQPFLIITQKAVFQSKPWKGFSHWCPPLAHVLAIASSWVLMLTGVFYMFRPGMYDVGIHKIQEDFGEYLSLFLPRSVLEWPVGIVW